MKEATIKHLKNNDFDLHVGYDRYAISGEHQFFALLMSVHDVCCYEPRTTIGEPNETVADLFDTIECDNDCAVGGNWLDAMMLEKKLVWAADPDPSKAAARAYEIADQYWGGEE